MKLRKHTSCLRWAAAGGNTPCLQNNKRGELTCSLMSSTNITLAAREMPRPSASIPSDEERFVTWLRSPLDEAAAESQRSDRGRQRLTRADGGRASGARPQLQPARSTAGCTAHMFRNTSSFLLRSETFRDDSMLLIVIDHRCLNVLQSAFIHYNPDLVLSLLWRCNTWISSSLINTFLILFGSCRQLPPLPLSQCIVGQKHTHTPKKKKLNCDFSSVNATDMKPVQKLAPRLMFKLQNRHTWASSPERRRKSTITVLSCDDC